MRINNNIMAMNTFRQYSVNSGSAASSTEKLSSGYRINRAGDDAAGLAISEKMRAQIRGLNMASKNSEDAISLVQTAEGALTETHSILQRMRELATQASSDTNDSQVVDRDALNDEFQALKAEINDISDKTAFNGKKLLNGEFRGIEITKSGLTADTTVKANSTVEVGTEVNISAEVTWSAAANATAAVGSAVISSGATALDAGTAATWNGNTKTGTQYNGTYYIGAKETSSGSGIMEYSLYKEGTTEAVATTLQALPTTADATVTLAFGDYGNVEYDQSGTPTAADVAADLTGKAGSALTLALTGGTDASKASFTLSCDGKDVKVEDGATSAEVAPGVTIGFDASIWGAGVDEDSVETALFGSADSGATAKITVGEGRAMIIQTGANSGDELEITIGDMSSSALSLDTYGTTVAAASGGDVSANDAITLKTQEGASAAITSVNNAINTVSTQRSKLGAYQNRLQHKINNLDTSSENLSAAESRIRDLDMAKEMTTYTKNNILVQASTAMLAQANSAPQGVLQLLQ